MHSDLLLRKGNLMKLKTLAVAIGAALPISALAATIDTTAATASPEFLAVEGGITAPAATLELGAQYAVGDILTINYSATPYAATASTTAFSWPTTLAINTVTAANTEGALSLFDSSATSVSYRVTAATVGEFGEVSMPQPIFQTANMAGADVTVSTSSATGTGTSFDAGKATKIIDITPSQYAFAVSGLAEVVDVESDRKKFLIGTTATSTAAFTVVATTGATTIANMATDGTIALVLNGDFTWLDSDTRTTATGLQSGNVSFAGAGSVVSMGATQIVFNLPATGDTVTFRNARNQVIPTQTLSAALTKQYIGSVATKTGAVTATASGAYTLNGSSVTVYAVPTSSSVSNFIWLTNSGSTSGEVTVVVNDNGKTHDLGVVGTSKAGAEFDVTAAMNDALEAEGISLSGGRVHLDIITRVPSADVAVSAAYRVGDDRVNLLTSLETNN